MKWFISTIFLLCTSFVCHADSTKFKGFSFELDGEWKVVNTNSTTQTVANESKKQVFILSVFQPTSMEQGVNILAELKNYLSNLNKQLPGMETFQELTPLNKVETVPWEITAYSTPDRERFFIAACLGSNLGALMVSLEGLGSVETEMPKFERILSSLERDET